LVPINIENVLKLAGANELIINEYKQKVAIANAELTLAKQWWLPTIYAGLNTHFLTGAVMNGDGRFFTDVSRSNLGGGLGARVDWDFGKGYYDKLVSKQRIEVIKQEVIASKNRQIIKAISAYYELQVAQMTYFSLEKLIQESESIVSQIKLQVEAELRQKSELLQAKANHNRLKIKSLKAQLEMKLKSSELVQSLNLMSNTQLISSDKEMLQVNFGDETNTLSLENRPEFKGLEAEINSLELERKQLTQGLLFPTLSVGGNTGAFGEFVSPLYFTNQFNAALTWKIPLGQLIYKGETEKVDAKAGLQQNYALQLKSEISKEVEQCQTTIELSQQQVTLAIEALKYSSEALNLSTERQKNGTAIPFEVFQAQEYHIQTQLDYYKSIAAFNKAKYELFVARGNNL
jgi:outer membrane protein TolC